MKIKKRDDKQYTFKYRRADGRRDSRTVYAPDLQRAMASLPPRATHLQLKRTV